MSEPSKVRPLVSQALHEKLFACSPDAIVVVDGEGRILMANPQAEQLFGYSCSELLGNFVELLMPERFRATHRAHRDAYARRPLTREMGTNLPLLGRHKEGREFPVDVMLSPVEGDDGNLVLSVIRDVSERKRLEEQLTQLAKSDALTGLGNYHKLQEAFAEAARWFQRTREPSALLLVDLDGLKQINDTMGHEAGSRALCRAAAAIQQECRRVDTATRHGGDEFSMILRNTGSAGAHNAARRIAHRLASDGEEPAVSFCYGVAVYPGDGATLEEILAAADRLLYAMKRARK